MICNQEQVTETSYSLRALNSALKKTLEGSIRCNGFETSYGILTVALCGDSDVSKDQFVFRRGVKFLKNGMNVSLLDGCHRFAALSALQAAGTHYPGQN